MIRERRIQDLGSYNFHSSRTAFETAAGGSQPGPQAGDGLKNMIHGHTYGESGCTWEPRRGDFSSPYVSPDPGGLLDSNDRSHRAAVQPNIIPLDSRTTFYPVEVR